MAAITCISVLIYRGFRSNYQTGNRVWHPLHQALLDSTAHISVLVETIKHPDFTFEQFSKHLSKQGIKLEQEVIQDFFIFYGIEKNAGFQVVNLLREVDFILRDVVEECIRTDAALGMSLGDVFAGLNRSIVEMRIGDQVKWITQVFQPTFSRHNCPAI